MRRALWLPLIVAAGVVVLTLGACTGSGAWTTAFMVEPDELASTGRNPYFILEPGYSLVLEGGNARLTRSEEHTSELQSRLHLVCRLLLEKKKKKDISINMYKTYC